VSLLVRRAGCALIASLVLVAVAAPSAPAAAPLGDAVAVQSLASGAKRIKYRVGPVAVTPGQNRIAYDVLGHKPTVDGFITRIKANLVRADGSVPPSSQIMFHHGVWLNMSSQDASTNGVLPERFFAIGEEKTILTLPRGFGYPYRADDEWLLNHMIHNLTPRSDELYFTYELDFIPATSRAAARTRPVRPVWMDVQNGTLYPVFDVLKGTGRHGRFTYPTQARGVYGSGPRRNEWTVDRDGVLVATAGHLHSGGLWNDLYLRRGGKQAHLFRSIAKYWEPAGPVSWDVSMTATRPGWRVKVRKGDVLRTSVTYETRRAAWPESMGIMVAYMADRGRGANPFKTRVDKPGRVTHGHLKENSNHGGGPSNLADARQLPASAFSGSLVDVTDFRYTVGDLSLSGDAGRPPVIQPGEALTFRNNDDGEEIYHSITSCKAPCNRSTGIAYPIADGPVQFESGQLGSRLPGVGTVEWTTPTSLKSGTYTYFCRIHPFMRGAFRVQQ
jgi:plastocyanin